MSRRRIITNSIHQLFDRRLTGLSVRCKHAFDEIKMLQNEIITRNVTPITVEAEDFSARDFFMFLQENSDRIIILHFEHNILAQNEQFASIVSGALQGTVSLRNLMVWEYIQFTGKLILTGNFEQPVAIKDRCLYADLYGMA